MLVLVVTPTVRAVFHVIEIQENFIIATSLLSIDDVYHLPLTGPAVPRLYFLRSDHVPGRAGGARGAEGVVENTASHTASPKPSPKALECCICYEENVSPKKITKCGHNMCQSCTNQLEKLECAYCKQKLSVGTGYVTSPLKKHIDQRIAKDKKITDTINSIIAFHYGNLSHISLKYEPRDYAYAFRFILEDSDIIDTIPINKILHGYGRFLMLIYPQENTREEKRPEDAIIQFAPEVLEKIYS